MSNSNTSGAYCTHRPSPVHRSWSTHTRTLPTLFLFFGEIKVW
jgi:hypothetical protein